MEAIRIVDAGALRKDRGGFEPGDTVKVWVKVIEGEKERTQAFEGVVIRKRGEGARASFTVRRISYGVGVERTFPLHSPSIGKLEVVTRSKVRRAKLYYLRERTGKKARIKERRLGDEELAAIAEAEAARLRAASADEEPVSDGEETEVAEASADPELAEVEGGEPLQADAPADEPAAGEAPEAEAEAEAEAAEVQG